jgi:hypothetical protein
MMNHGDDKSTDTACPVKRLVRPGMGFTRNGITIKVHFIEDGEVYYQKWPKGVEEQRWFENLSRLPVDEFEKGIEGATVTA